MDGPVTAGTRSFRWDGRDDAGRDAAAGVYIARFVVGGASGVTKMVMVR